MHFVREKRYKPPGRRFHAGKRLSEKRDKREKTYSAARLLLRHSRAGGWVRGPLGAFVHAIFMLTSFCLSGRFLMNLFRYQFVLVRSEVIDMSSNSGAPSYSSRIERAEVVVMEPAIAT
jgi:hypothetical protein